MKPLGRSPLSEGRVIALLAVGSASTFLRDLQIGKYLPADSAVRYLAAIAVIGAVSNILTFWALGSGWYPKQALWRVVLALIAVASVVEIATTAQTLSLITAGICCAGCQVVANLAIANGQRRNRLGVLLVVGVVGPVLIAVAATFALDGEQSSRPLYWAALYLAVQALITLRIDPVVQRLATSRQSLAANVLGWSIAMQVVVTVGRLVTAADNDPGVAILGAHAWTSMVAATALASLYVWRRSSAEWIDVAPARLVMSLTRQFVPWFGATALVAVAAGAALLGPINSVVGQDLDRADYLIAILPVLLAFVPVLVLSLVVRSGKPELFSHWAMRGWTLLCLVAALVVAAFRNLERWGNGVNTVVLVVGLLAALRAVQELARREPAL